jgi:mono/diheme cytochrome c family protein
MRTGRSIARGGRRFAIGLVALLATWVGVALVLAQDSETAARGKVLFRVYCANCHGATAHGDGELAKLLTLPPADLTRITRRYEGEFPADWIRKKIDGRERVRGHGMQEMPVWGLSFRNPADPGDQEPQVGAKLDQLVDYLRSIQAEP